MKKIFITIFLFCFVFSSEAAEVSFYGWGGDPKVNAWLDTWVSEQMNSIYGIKFRRVGMDIGDILRKLSSEKTSGKNDGSIDVIWINGENFYSARQRKLLHGEFVSKIKNFEKYVDKEDSALDFGFPTDGMEAAWGRAQLVMFADAKTGYALSGGAKELLEFARKNPSKLTYPAPPDFTGSAFLRSLAYSIIPKSELVRLTKIGAGEDEVRKILQPLMDYLRELAPYLWNQGKSYPATSAQLSNMYADGEVLMGMSYTPYYALGKVADGSFPPDTVPFVFDSGTVGNTHFLSIPFNAPNYENALLLINFLLSPEAQAQKNDMRVWGDLPVLSDISTIEKNDMLEHLNAHRRQEFAADIIPIIDRIWRENLFGTR